MLRVEVIGPAGQAVLRGKASSVPDVSELRLPGRAIRPSAALSLHVPSWQYECLNDKDHDIHEQAHIRPQSYNWNLSTVPPCTSKALSCKPASFHHPTSCILRQLKKSTQASSNGYLRPTTSCCQPLRGTCIYHNWARAGLLMTSESS